MRWIAAALVVSTSLALAPRALAEPTPQQKEQARKLLDIGDERMRAKDYGRALEAYLAADKIMGVPTTGVAAAQAYTAQGMLVEAHDLLLRVSRYEPPVPAPSAFVKAQQDAAAQAAKLEARLPSLTLEVSNRAARELRITVDGNAFEPAGLGFPMPVNPGSHVAVATAPGYRDATVEARVAEGEHKRVALTLVVDPNASVIPPLGEKVDTKTPASEGSPPAPPTRHVPAWSWVAFGVGGAGLLTGAITGGLALGKAATLEDACTNRVCDSSMKGTIEANKRLSMLSTLGFAIGGVGVATGVVGALLGLRAPGSVDTGHGTVGFVLRPMGIDVEGSF